MTSPERMSLADAYFHFRETGSRSDRQAVIELSPTIRAGKLGKPIAGKTTELRAGGMEPRITLDQPIPAAALADPLGMKFDWELSKALWKSQAGYFSFESITVERNRVLALRRPTSPTIPKGLKRGPRGYGDREMEPFKIKFYAMLYENDVAADANIAVEAYARDLMDWGERNELKTPKRTTMFDAISEWLPLWREFNAFKD
jgi:hypothetical protein